MRNDDISPIFYALADQYLDDISLVAGTSPVKFKTAVKNALLTYVDNSLEDYFKGFPFLHFSRSDIDNDGGGINFSENIKDFLLSRKILKVKSKTLQGVDGMLIPRIGGFTVMINDANYSHRRILTSLAHEVGHTYFYDIFTDPPTPLINRSILKSEYFHGEWEGLAYDVGRTLLLPKKHFETYVNDFCRDISLKNFLKMYNGFKVSKDILAKRMFWDLGLWDAYLFWGYHKDGTIIVSDKDKFRIKKGKFRYFTLGEAIRSNSLKLVILDDENKIGYITLEKIIEKMDEINKGNVNCKSKNFNKICKLDIGDYNEESDGRISFKALLY